MARAPSGARRRAGGGSRSAPAGRSSSGEAVRKGSWMADEDAVLREHVRVHGPREWNSLRSKGVLPRTGKSCRLRWLNKLRPNLKSSCKFDAEEESVVLDLQEKFGNKWARIATYLPGRTDNDVKNFWSNRQKRLARLMHPPRHRQSRKNLGAKKAADSASTPRLTLVTFMDQVPFEGSSQCRASTLSMDAENVPYDQTDLQHLRSAAASSLQLPPLVGPFLDHCPPECSSSGGRCYADAGTVSMHAQKSELASYDQTGSELFGFGGTQQPPLATDTQATSNAANLWPPEMQLYQPPYPELDFPGTGGCGDKALGFVSASASAMYDFAYQQELLPFMQSSEMTFPSFGMNDGIKIEPEGPPDHFDDLPLDLFDDSADQLPATPSPSQTISDV